MTKTNANIFTLLAFMLSSILALIAGAGAFLLVVIQTPLLSLAVGAALAATAVVGAIVQFLIGRTVGRLGAGALVALGVPLIFFGGLHFLEALRPVTTLVTDELIAALAQHTHEIESVDPRAPFDDLEPFLHAVADRTVVALGESTHGTAEFFTMKHRLMRALVIQGGFRHFAMEVHPNTGRVLNEYIQGGDVDPSTVLGWPWGTIEYLELLEWMRSFNDEGKQEGLITLHGIDPVFEDRDRGMAEHVVGLLESRDGDAGIIVWAANSHVHAIAGGMGQHLKEHLGDEVYLLGLEFHEGEFTSRTKDVHTYRAGPFPPSYYSYSFARLPGRARFGDFVEMSSDPTITEWLRSERYSNSMYELYAVNRLFPGSRDETMFKHRTRTAIDRRFDGVIQVHSSTPATAARSF